MALPVDPDERARREDHPDRSQSEGERSFRGHRKLAGPRGRCLGDAFHDGNRAARHRQTPGIERDGQQRSVVDIHELTGGKNARIGTAIDEGPAIFSVQRLDDNLALGCGGAHQRR
jgi:hypothetical protein